MNRLLLPAEVTRFEHEYLVRVNRIALQIALAHFPVLVAIAFFNDTGVFLACALTSAVLAGPVLASKSFENKRSVSIVLGLTFMFLGGLIVHFGQGPAQLELHFYFFATLALLAVFANPAVILAATLVALAHHVFLWFFLPSSLLNYEAPFWILSLHAIFVLFTTAGACFLARSFFDSVVGVEEQIVERTKEVREQTFGIERVLEAVMQNASVASSSAQGVASNADEMIDSIGQFDSSIKAIAETTNAVTSVAQSAVEASGLAHDQIQQLNHTSEQIGSMVNEITSIADQTNLLALNATIEAARAGEFGKGFAVVANEVKELAKQSSAASEAIVQLIESIRHDTSNAQRAINDISKLVGDISSNQVAVVAAVDEQSSLSKGVSHIATSVADTIADVANNIKGIVDLAENGV